MNTDCDYCGRSDNEGSVINEDGVAFHFCHRHEAEVRTIAGEDEVTDLPTGFIKPVLPPPAANQRPTGDEPRRLPDDARQALGWAEPVKAEACTECSVPVHQDEDGTWHHDYLDHHEVVLAVKADRCVHCGKAVHNEIHDGHTFIIDDETGGDVCGNWGTFTNEPHAVEATVTYTVKATFTSTVPGYQDAWDEWVEWLTHPMHLEDGTETDIYVDEDVLRGDR